MATVTIPLIYSEFTGGARRADVEGSTILEIIAALDRLHPGLAAKVRDGENLSPTIAITVDGKIAAQGLATPVAPQSEVCMLPSFGGG